MKITIKKVKEREFLSIEGLSLNGQTPFVSLDVKLKIPLKSNFGDQLKKNCVLALTFNLSQQESPVKISLKEHQVFLQKTEEILHSFKLEEMTLDQFLSLELNYDYFLEY